MADPAIKFSLTTEPPIEGMVWALDQMADGVSDFSTLFEGFGSIFRGFMQQQFATEGSFGAGGWSVLTKTYALWKEEHYPGRPIGVLTGALRKAMTGAEGYSAEITKDSASWGMSGASSASVYGKHFAARRPVIKWSGQQSRAFQKFSHVWLHHEIDKALGHGGSAGGSGFGDPEVPGVFGGL